MLGKARNVVVRFDARHGKGSHGHLYYSDRFTIVKDRKQEIGPGLFAKMLRDLDLRREDMEG